MGQCYCTGRCRQGFPCAAYPSGKASLPPERGTLKITPNTLTEEDVRRIVREELGKVGDGLRNRLTP